MLLFIFFFCPLLLFDPPADTISPVPIFFQTLPPTRSQPPLEAIVGGNITFEATAIADEGITFQWSRRGGVLLKDRTERVGEGNLRISPVHKKDEGTYQVTATAGAGTASPRSTTALTHLVVHGKGMKFVFYVSRPIFFEINARVRKKQINH